MSAKSSDLTRLSRLVVDSAATELRLIVRSPQAHGDALEAKATIGDHREAIARIVGPCLKAAK